MKAFSTLIALLPALALAVPTNYGGEHKEGEGKSGELCDAFPFEFTSTLVAYATPDTIINNNQTSVPGLEGGSGIFRFGLNSKEDYICYAISLYISGNYSSPAKTATHIHEAPVGRAGPPRLAFENPSSGASLDEFSWRYSSGCMKGPFTTGLAPNGTDTGAGFTIAELEANPSGFFADSHTEEFLAGAVRGQVQTRD